MRGFEPEGIILQGLFSAGTEEVFYMCQKVAKEPEGIILQGLFSARTEEVFYMCQKVAKVLAGLR